MSETPIGVAVLGHRHGHEVVRIIEESATDLTPASVRRSCCAASAAAAWPTIAGVPIGVATDQRGRTVSRDDVDIVVELMGPVEPARKAILAALEQGKSVVTANKALWPCRPASWRRPPPNTPCRPLLRGRRGRRHPGHPAAHAIPGR